jgi:hypothetical protein
LASPDPARDVGKVRRANARARAGLDRPSPSCKP